jgi:DNA primase
LFVAGKVDLRVLTLPDEQDPAEYLLAHGRQALESLVAQAPDALQHARLVATEGIDLRGDVHRASVALEELVATIAKAPRLRADTLVEDRLREEKFLQRLAVDFGVPEEQVRQLMTAQRRKKATREERGRGEAVASVQQPMDPLERELLEVLLQVPAMFEQVALAIQPAQFAAGRGREIFSRCGQLWARGILPDCHRLLLEIDDPVVKNLLIELDEQGGRKKTAEAPARLQDVLAGFERRQQEHQLRGPLAALKQRQLAEEDEQAVLLELERQQRARQQQQTERARQGSSDPTEG